MEEATTLNWQEQKHGGSHNTELAGAEIVTLRRKWKGEMM
jgi:hypothetical protein